MFIVMQVHLYAITCTLSPSSYGNNDLIMSANIFSHWINLKLALRFHALLIVTPVIDVIDVIDETTAIEGGLYTKYTCPSDRIFVSTGGQCRFAANFKTVLWFFVDGLLLAL